MDPETVPFALFYETVMDHYALVKQRYAPERAFIVFRKFAKKYLTKLGTPKDEIHQILTMKNPDEFEAALSRLASVDRRSHAPGTGTDEEGDG